MGKLKAVLWLVMVICFGFNFYVWGGLKSTPVIEKLLLADPMGTPLAATYMVIGEKVNGTIGQTDAAREYVGKKFADLIAHPENLQYLAVNKFQGAQGPLGMICYWLAPLLLVLNLVLHFMRQKQVKSLGSS